MSGIDQLFAQYTVTEVWLNSRCPRLADELRDVRPSEYCVSNHRQTGQKRLMAFATFLSSVIMTGGLAQT